MALRSLTIRTQDALRDEYDSAVGSGGSMNYDAFVTITGCKSMFFAQRLFRAIDVDNSGDITFEEFVSAVNLLQTRDSDGRVEFIFRIIDEDNSGTVQLNELTNILEASVEETDASFSDEELRDLGKKLMDIFLEGRGPDERGDDVTLDEFARLMKKYPDMLNGLSLEGITGRQKGRSQPKKKTKNVVLKMVSWVRNNRQLSVTYAAYFTMVLGLFLWRFLRYAGNCKGVDLSVVDEVSSVSRADVMSMANQWRSENNMAPIVAADMKYMSFSKSMAKGDPVRCQDARKRMLLSWTLPIAKGAGQAMKGTFTMILLPVSRNFMTTLQNTFLKDIFPFYDAVEVHRNMGKIGFFLAWLHTLCHVVDVIRWSDTGRFKRWSWAFPNDNQMGTIDEVAGSVGEDLTKFDGIPAYLFRNPGSQTTAKELLGSWFGVTGICLIFIYTIAALFAFDYPKKLKVFNETAADKGGTISWNRKAVLSVGGCLRNFNNFWYTHHLFAVFYVCMLLHPLPHIPEERNEWGWSDSWLWAGVPIFLYLLERILRIIRSTSSHADVVLADIFQGNVVNIKVQKPLFFGYQAGMYAFINIPELSTSEWHPFTLTSSPGDSYLGFHIRAAGDWTQALYNMVKRYKEEKEAIKDVEMELVNQKPEDNMISGVTGPKIYCDKNIPFTVHVDGPFGAPAQNFKSFEVMILVGAGIGVTPFASVLSDLLEYIKGHKCKSCGNSTSHNTIKKVYFYWTTRLRNEVVWFKHLLEEIAVEDTQGLFDINVHITSFRDACDIRMVFLRLTQTKVAENEGVDIMSDVKTRAVTKFGRPNWDVVFTRARDEYPEVKNIGVFFCGPKALGKVLGSHCKRYSCSARKYHILKESFG